MQIFPADAVNVEHLVSELANVDVVFIYNVNGRDVLQVRNFSRHQRVNRPTPSKFPAAPDPNPIVPRETFTESSVSNHGTLTHGTRTRTGTGKELEVKSCLDNSSSFLEKGVGENPSVETVESVKKVTATPTPKPANEVTNQRQLQNQTQAQDQSAV